MKHESTPGHSLLTYKAAPYRDGFATPFGDQNQEVPNKYQVPERDIDLNSSDLQPSKL